MNHLVNDMANYPDFETSRLSRFEIIQILNYPDLLKLNEKQILVYPLYVQNIILITCA